MQSAGVPWMAKRSEPRLAFFATRFDAHTFVPGHGVAHAGLRRSRCNDGGFAKILRGFEQRIQSGSVDAIVVCDQEFHGNRFYFTNCVEEERTARF